jgi:FemAB family
MNCDIFDGHRGRRSYRATLPRDKNDAPGNQLISRANKLLQWQTMLTMKSAGIKIYDLGGISNSTKLQGIDNFKRQFSGVEIEEHNAIIGVSGLGKLALKASNLLNRSTDKSKFRVSV